MLPIENVINISVQETPIGLGERNVANLALFTAETPENEEFDTYGVYISPGQVAADFGVDSECYAQAQAIFAQQPNILAGGGVLYIFTLEVDEDISDAIERTKDIAYYCGVLTTEDIASEDMLAESTAVEAFGDKVLYLSSSNDALLTGAFLDIQQAGNSNTRCLYYGLDDDEAARGFVARYASRLHAVNYAGSNSAITMNLKVLRGIMPDASLTQTLVSQAETAGVDLYASYSGRPAVISHGNNSFADEVLNRMWLVNALKISGFNALAQVSTKIPQTEAGMSILKGVYRRVCEQSVNNGYVAPGEWTSPEWFGHQEDFINNISERGYYIYSQPVNKQSVAEREARQAPLVQIAIKQAGAVHKANVIVNINR